MRRFAPASGAVVPAAAGSLAHRADADDGRHRDRGGHHRRVRWRCVARPDLVGAPADWVPVPLAALAMFVVGVLDDRLQLSPLAKLVSSLAIGAFLVFALAGTDPDGALPSLFTLVAIVWFAGICHAMNLLDNMDGLAAGVGLIAAVFLAALMPGYLGSTVVVLLTSLAGALLGFLYWNRSRARLFMGDCGSLFIGALLAPPRSCRSTTPRSRSSTRW